MLGFDIGSSELKIAQWDGKSVKRLVSESLPENMVKNGAIVSYEAMAELIKTVMKDSHLSGDRTCAVVLPETQVFLRRVTMPEMTADLLAINLPYEFRDFQTMDKEGYFYDYVVNEIKTDEEGKPQQFDLTAAAVPKDVISKYRSMFQMAGLKLRVAIPRELAYANLLQRVDDGRGSEYCFIDLGQSSTKLDIYTGAVFETSRVIDTGIDAVDRAIAEAVSVDAHTARLYRRTNHEGAQLLPVATEIYGSIALELRRALNFYAFNNRESQLASAWLCGGGTHIGALCEAVAQSVDLELRGIDELLPPLEADAGEDARSFTAAIGAAVQEATK